MTIIASVTPTSGGNPPTIICHNSKLYKLDTKNKPVAINKALAARYNVYKSSCTGTYAIPLSVTTPRAMEAAPSINKVVTTAPVRNAPTQQAKSFDLGTGVAGTAKMLTNQVSTAVDYGIANPVGFVGYAFLLLLILWIISIPLRVVIGIIFGSPDNHR